VVDPSPSSPTAASPRSLLLRRRRPLRFTRAAVRPACFGAKNGITVSQILPNPVLPPSFLRRSAMGKVETSCLRWAAPNPREKTRTQCRPPFFACPVPTNADSYIRIWRSNATKSTDPTCRGQHSALARLRRQVRSLEAELRYLDRMIAGLDRRCGAEQPADQLPS
jgi:hypothetical protein